MPFLIQPEFSPGAPRGVCFVCKSSRRQGDVVVDCLVDPDDLLWKVESDIPGMDFELASGNLEICSSCWTEASQLLGMISKKQADLLQVSNDSFKAAWADAVDRAEIAERALEGVRRYDEARKLAESVFGPEPV